MNTHANSPIMTGWHSYLILPTTVSRSQETYQVRVILWSSVFADRVPIITTLNSDEGNEINNFVREPKMIFKFAQIIIKKPGILAL